jgi:hypothetical protein
MSKTTLTILAVTSTLVLSGMVRANAATITEYDFSATFGSSAPVSTWDGSLAITFDPTASSTLSPLALKAFSSKLAPSGYGTFEYSQTPMLSGGLINVGDFCISGSCSALFLASFVNGSGVPTPISAGITSTSGNQGSATPTVTLAAMPPPAAVLPFAIGLGGLVVLGLGLLFCWGYAGSGMRKRRSD